jgi:2,4-dienoyl-CoA reductase-like NADH-dependent reductase (Old Yellow Enzyme family)
VGLIDREFGWKNGHYDARIAETPQEPEALLAAAGVDAFHASTRRYWLPEFDGSDLNLAGWAKKLSGKPTITVGSVGLDNDLSSSFRGEAAAVTSIDGLLDRLERDEFDLVAVGRSLLADHSWAAKVLTGRTDELTPFSPKALQTLH